MSNAKTTAIAKKYLDQREMLWPSAAPQLWHRKTHQGYTTIPKTMPLVLKVMDDLSNGKPLSATYLGLWCATWDNSFLTIVRPDEMALAAGFSGQRAGYTWAARVKLLQELNFIDFKPGKAGPITHVIIWNPHTVIRQHYENKTPGIIEGTYNILLDRALDIGAKDMTGLTNAPESPSPAVSF